jgi:hypothetical protein
MRTGGALHRSMLALIRATCRNSHTPLGRGGRRRVALTTIMPVPDFGPPRRRLLGLGAAPPSVSDAVVIGDDAIPRSGHMGSCGGLAAGTLVIGAAPGSTTPGHRPPEFAPNAPLARVNRWKGLVHKHGTQSWRTRGLPPVLYTWSYSRSAGNTASQLALFRGCRN